MVGLVMYLQLGERPASLTSMAAKPRGECSFRELAASMPAAEEDRPATPPPPRREGARWRACGDPAYAGRHLVRTVGIQLHSEPTDLPS